MNIRARNPRTPPRRRAFTLVETIAALVILTVAVPTTLWGIRTAVARRTDPILASRARWLTAEKIEDIIADSNDPNRLYAYVVNANYSTEAAVTGFTNFSRSVSIVESGANLVGGSGTGYKTVTVSVGYTDTRGVARTYQLATVITDYSP